MAGMQYNPVIQLADVAFLGEAPNYNTLMPHGAKFNPAGVDAVDKTTLTVQGAIVAGATKIPLTTKLNNSVGIVSGMTLRFGAVDVVTSSWTSPEAKEIMVYPTSGAIADATVLSYPGYGARPLRSGTTVGRTVAERDAGALFGLGDGGDYELFLVAFDVPDVTTKNEIVLVRWGTRIKENRIPGFGALAAGVQVKLRQLYQMYRGT